ncbi:hypothetical protein NPX13_g5366 [Xylaria arbuscula]|uniref:DDE-1 domain-containing protein n=1 Tax=Xylaria arbuscula TaxID=114810 RepID=A0A9W8NDS8_9PEZI|nr:hypothetical protein NPX13_g5366 [Xylaria arbuscula]
MNRKYDYQRALCEDPDVISRWFGLVANIKAKYGIQDEDIYNFDETGFMIGVISSTLVITRADRRGKAKTRTKGLYRLLVLDGHESHISAKFEVYCKDNNIITLSMPPHSSHLLQPLDIALYSPLKRAYSKEIEQFIKASINHITKPEFFIAFKAAHFAIFKEENIKSGFRAAGLVPYNPDEVIRKLDVRLRTPTPGPSRPGTASTYNPQTPSNSQQTVRHSTFIKSKISTHQGSSPTPILEAVDQMAKGMQVMAHQMTLMREELHTLREANQALAKTSKS